MALIRYPGSKEKLAKLITGHFPIEMYAALWMDSNRWEYREPFFGAGAIGFLILKRLPPSCPAWLNDKDYSIVCLWQSIWQDIDRLCQKIEQFIPATEHYYKFKEEDGQSDYDPVEIGFRKLALHQMSYSGLGFMSGGPLGGKSQDNELYAIDCRWNSASLISQAVGLHKILKKIPQLKITCKDFSALIDDNPKAFLYLDPPYYNAGPELYKYAMNDIDHQRLAKLLQYTKNQWILSYDETPEILNLYQWANVHKIEITYTIGNKLKDKKRPKNLEILLTPAMPELTF